MQILFYIIVAVFEDKVALKSNKCEKCSFCHLKRDFQVMWDKKIY